MIIFSFLQVDGSLLTNAGSAAGSFGGGGSGGSIFITTGVLTGGHTGVIQSKGGPVSTSYNGGGGAGGRIAAYYNNSIKDAFYGGVFETDGGSAGSSSESGASGTVYLKHTGQNNTKLIVDNSNGWVMETDITARGQKLELYSGFSATSTSVSKNGITVSSSCRIYSVTHSHITTMYSLSALFDQTYKFSYYSAYNIRGSQVYIGDCHSGYIRVLLPKPVLVNSVRIYPVQGVSFKVRSLMLLMIINILYHITLYNIILYYIILHYILLHYIISYYILLYYIIFYYIILHYIILYYIILYYITLYYIILYHIILYYIIFYSIYYIIKYVTLIPTRSFSL